MPKYEVMRRHDGDKEYFEGDERTLTKTEAQHLVELGVLKEAGDDEPAAKAEAPVENKAEDAPLNKADKPSRKKAEG